MTEVFSDQHPVHARIGDPNRRGVRGVRKVFTYLIGSDPQPTKGQMEEIRRHMLAGDPLADAVVAMYKALPPGEGRKLVDRALENGIGSISNPPQALVNLFAQVDHEPIWLDRTKLDLACDVSRRIGPSGELVLRNLSLMGGYLGAAAAKPLVFTGQLDKQTPRRLVETTKFWVDVTTRGGLERNADGFKSTIRVRLMHAQVRAMLLESSKWNIAWGHPLNQWDSMATILEFSVIFLNGLRALGFIFPKREREAVVHLWRYVGYLIGVDERLLPANEDDSMRALYQVLATVCEPDDDTRRLGQSLANSPLQVAGDTWFHKQLANLEYTLRVGYSRYVLGDRAGDALGLPRTRAKYFWPAQIPLRMGVELVRMSVPAIGEALIRRNNRLVQTQFPEAVKQTGANTTFTPVQQLAR